MRYTVKNVQIEAGSEKKDFVYEDENGNQVIGSDEKCGLLFRKGEQLFDSDGKELEAPKGVKKIGEYIGRDNKKCYELFYATKENGKKTILEYEFSDGGYCYRPSKKLCWIRGLENAEIVTIELKDTLFEVWLKQPKYSEDKTELKDWFLIKSGKKSDAIYTFLNTKSRARLSHLDYTYNCDLFSDISGGSKILRLGDDYFTTQPVFKTSKYGEKGMIVGDYVSREKWLLDHNDQWELYFSSQEYFY